MVNSETLVYGIAVTLLLYDGLNFIGDYIRTRRILKSIAKPQKQFQKGLEALASATNEFRDLVEALKEI